MLIPLCLALVAGPSLAAAHADASTARLSFNRDVRPILSDRCFPCHGPDAGARQAGLRLDNEAAYDFEHEGRRALVPGDLESSELVRRIQSADPAVHMPPPDSGLTLTQEEQGVLAAWVAQGAEYEAHWAFVPPGMTQVPSGTGWSRGAIDRFIEDRLRNAGLEPAPVADAETLLRRLHLDLTGLPPTPEQLDAFALELARDPAAYERQVDRLLGTPAHAERMAQVWLDAARYADTNGFHHDNERTIWPWRDWVLRAFQENKPYDEFVVEQLAGDLLPEADDQDRIATAFARLHNINDEGGALDEEYRVEAVADRIETVATVFMGLTFTCARCHDHKYDPFTQEDYYSLYAFFNSVEERGVYPNNFEASRAYPARLLFTPAELEEEIAQGRQAQEEARLAREQAAPEVAAEQAEWEGALWKLHDLEWQPLTLLGAESEGGLTLTEESSGSLLASGEVPERDVHEIVWRTPASALSLLRFDALPHESLPQGGSGLASHSNSVLSAIELEVRSLTDPEATQNVSWSWAWADFEQANADFDIHNVLRPDELGWALGGHAGETRTALFLADEPFGFEGGSELRLKLHYESAYPQHIIGHFQVQVARAEGDLRPYFPVVTRDVFLNGPHAAENFDVAFERAFGPESIERLDLTQSFEGKGWQHRADFEDGEVYGLSGPNSAFYLARSVFTPIERTLELSLGSDDSIQVYRNGEELLTNRVFRGTGPDQERLRVDLPAGENVLVFKVTNGGGPAGFYYREIDGARSVPGTMPFALLEAGTLDDPRKERYQEDWRGLRSPTYRRLDDALQAARKRVSDLEGERVPVLVMQELEEPTPTFVLERGSYELPNPERPVARRTPAALQVAWPAEAPQDRLGFARWLVQPDHPLTARVHVNRLWQMIFGVGLVASSENFGLQAEWPSHPELLDWLARRLVELDWDARALLREIVTSSVYRQQARRNPAADEIDPDNRLLSYFPRQRLAGEFVRDLALHVSGLLVRDVGGPSVRPYQPAGLWREVSIGGSSNTRDFVRDDGENLYRRSLYTFWKRTSPTPQMTIFDAPTREFCVVRRGTTNTPLQALVLWNDEQFVEAARALAERTLDGSFESEEARLIHLFRTCTARRPEPAELTLLTKLLRDLEQSFAGREAEMEQLLSIGEHPTGPPPTRELAAWSLLASTVLSLDETLVRD